MGKIIPFFYYDILACMVPGAATLAALLVIRDLLPHSWTGLFSGDQGWKTVVVPLMLGGISYVVGVVYETFDSPPAKWARRLTDDTAFESAWTRFCESKAIQGDVPTLKSTKEKLEFRSRVWEKLVLEAARAPEMNSVFAHCHRFQAEYKMFFHLIYPTLLFVVLCFARGFLWSGSVSLLLIIPALSFFAYRRDERRWWQVLSFGDQLGWLR